MCRVCVEILLLSTNAPENIPIQKEEQEWKKNAQYQQLVKVFQRLPKRKFSGAGVANATAGLVALDYAGDKVISMLPKFAAVYGATVATSYALKRVIDGAINRNLAETSHILEDVGLKDQIWSKVEDFADSHGGDLPSKEQLKKIVHDEIDSYFENEDRTLGQKLQDTVKSTSNTAKKYSNAVAAYFNSNQSQN